MWYVTEYALSREYGGPEEGGWYFDWFGYTGRYVRSRSERAARRMAKHMNAEVGRYDRGREVYIAEKRPGLHQTRRRPRYQ